MNAIDYIIIGVLAALVAIAVISIIKRRKKGGGCGCGCSSCPSRITCEGKKEQE